MSNAPCSVKPDCWRYGATSKAACAACASPITNIPIISVNGPEWMGWIEMTRLFDRAGLQPPSGFHGVRRFYSLRPGMTTDAVYFRPDVMALIQETKATITERALHGGA